ncbi:MAG: class II glutamine amidotransferase [Caldisericaceae bacterium]
MCRILYLSGNNGSLAIANYFIDSFVEASENDVLGKDGPIQHGDGFGYVIFGVHNGKRKEFSFKSIKPVFESSEDINVLKSTLGQLDKFALGIHSRKASAGSVNLFNVHPFHFSTKAGSSFYLMHNGTLSKDKLESDVGIASDNDLTDSYILGLLLSRKIEKLESGFVFDFFKNSLQYVESTLNVISMFRTVDNKQKAFLTAYSKKDFDYTKIFTYKNDYTFALASSTVSLYAEKIGIQMELLQNGQTVFIEDVFKNEIMFNSLL